MNHHLRLRRCHRADERLAVEDIAHDGLHALYSQGFGPVLRAGESRDFMAFLD